MPYITASIILQLMTVVVPSLEKLRKEGEVGQQKITQYTRYLTVGLAFAQSIGFVFVMRSQATGGQELLESFTIGHVFVIVTTLTAGCVFIMWLGELITQRGIGNGISLMIFASIVSGLPSGIGSWWQSGDQVFKVMMPFVCLAVIAAVVFIQEGQRRIPVQYAKRVVGQRMTGGGSTYLPLRVNMAGVIPVIFAASIMAFPATLGQISSADWARDVSAAFQAQSWGYVVGESVFIILFTYFYTAVTFNPVEQADNLKKYGGFIPGVRPGRPTAEYLDRILARLTLPGALYLAARGRAAHAAAGPDLHQHRLRRHLAADRGRRGAGHHEAAGGPDDDAELRRLPEVAPCCARLALVSELNLILWARPGPARAPRPSGWSRTSTCPTTPPATSCAPRCPRAPTSARPPRSTWTRATWCPTRSSPA